MGVIYRIARLAGVSLCLAFILGACSNSETTQTAESTLGVDPTPAVNSTSDVPTPASPLSSESVAPSEGSPSLAPSSTLAPSPTQPPTQTQEPSPTPTSQPATPTSSGVVAHTGPRPDFFPDPAAYSWQPVATGFERPVGITHAGDGSQRLFIVEQPGRIRILHEGQALPEPFLDISTQVGCCGERGLLGLAFHPQYAETGYFYVNYTDLSGNTVISRFSVSPDDPNLALADSEQVLITVDQPYPNHNGGSVQFGPDSLLYLGLGDGGSQGDPHGNAQSLQTRLGKILRIDVNAGDPYGIPPDNLCSPENPAAPQGCAQPEIWAYGLRNPWRLSFDRQTGDLYLADVGGGQWEEINFLPAPFPSGVNFGWDLREGAHPYQGEDANPTGLLDPVAEYDHSLGCSVTGGYVYRGQALPAWQGIYLFGDYCAGSVWGMARGGDGQWQLTMLFDQVATITSFGEDEAGEIYLAGHGGEIFLLVEK